MPYNSYPFELPPLPYQYDALEPFIDASTMHYHHDKHFQTYITNLNAALKPYPKLHHLNLEQLLMRQVYPNKDVYRAVMNNAGGVYNHMLFFNGMAPVTMTQKHKPSPEVCALIKKAYGSYEDFKKEFTKQALGVFGSGYACLALTPRKRVEILTLSNQQTPVRLGAKPILLLDVWEHAYYLKYKNARVDYVNNVWNVLAYLG